MTLPVDNNQLRHKKEIERPPFEGALLDRGLLGNSFE